MSKPKPMLDERAREFFRRAGHKGGKRSLETMTQAERSARARKAAQARPRRLDWDGILKMRSEGATIRQVAEAFGCTESAVSRIVSRMRARAAKKRGR